jgi:hypothetical protein
MEGPKKYQNFQILSIWFCSWIPNYKTKVPSDLFYDGIRLTKLSIPYSGPDSVCPIWTKTFEKNLRKTANL